MISVLIVDDELLIRETLAHYIQWPELGVDTVQTAADGKRALEIIQSAQPDIILSDIKMPHMNGIQLAQIVKESFPDIRFVILSGYADKEYLMEAIHLHLDAYIEKPINLEEVSTAVRTLATKCRRKKLSANQASNFYTSESSDTALNKRVFALTQALLQRIERVLKENDRQAALNEIRDFCTVVKSCEGTAHEYIQNAYMQLVLLIQSTAAVHHAQDVCDECSRFSSEAVRVARVDGMESEVLRITELLFDEKSSKTLNPVKLVNDYIEKNFADNDLTVDKLARDLNFNTSYLCTIYKQHTNCTINSALTAFRIETACKYLCSSDMKLHEIAARVGYSSGKYFTRVFLKEKDISPQVYRRIHRV